MEPVKKVLNHIWDFLESITFASAIFIVAYLFLFKPSVVMGTSSYPTIKPDEKVISEKVSYYFSQPKRGDFVILQSPKNSNIDFIKRIVGLPGENIRISQGKVYINSVLLDESYLPEGTFTGPEGFLAEDQEIVIPSEHFFVMGDNREHSSDSRDFGPVRQETIEGHVVFRFWPIERIGLLN